MPLWLVLSTAALLTAALATAGCANKAPPAAAIVYPYKADAAKVFYATPAGLSEMTFQGEADEALSASRAPNAAVLSSDGKAMLVAVNGWGVEMIEPSPDGRAYRLVDRPLPALSGLSTGGAWPLNGGFLIQLYHDPFVAAPEPSPSSGGASRATSSRLVYIDADGTATAPDPFPAGLDSGFALFVLLPSRGKWFAELRKDSPERVELKFFSFDTPLAPPSSSLEIRRAGFEAALSPLPLSSLAGEAGEALRSALGALGKGPWLARLRSGAGDDRWYLSSGMPEEATRVYAWSLKGPAGDERALALVGEGRLSMGGASSASVTQIQAPVEGAVFTALAATAGTAAAAWEAGDFPSISSAGIVLMPLPR